MARALMTPDELRRMDNDLCIIFEKGIKPIKARKYYYFEKPRVIKDLQRFTMNHNEFQGIQRGEWRKYNPYNPYVPKDQNQKEEENLKIDSLDDLFETEEIPKKEEEVKEPLKVGANIKEQEKEEAPLLPQEDFDVVETPKEDQKKSQEEIDLQKELEAKFDELFGPIDDNEE